MVITRYGWNIPHEVEYDINMLCEVTSVMRQNFLYQFCHLLIAVSHSPTGVSRSPLGGVRCLLFTEGRTIFSKKKKTCLMLSINHKIVFILKVSNLYNCGQGYLYKYILYSYSTRFFLFFLMFWLINWCSFYFKPRSGSDILTGSNGGLLVPLSRPRCWQHCCKK